jgi:fructose-1,6-bisphosphatase II
MGELPRNLGLDLVRATEAAAIQAGRWMGLGNPDKADLAAGHAMYATLNTCPVDGCILIGEEGKVSVNHPLESGRIVGKATGPQIDLVVDPVDGRSLLAQGRSGAIAVAAITPKGVMWSPKPAIYMEKIVVNREVGAMLVEECLDAPAAWTLALVARAKDKSVQDLTVFVLDRPRHMDLINEIRAAGARVMLRSDGDIAGAILAAGPDDLVDLMIGIGGAPEGMISACAVKAMKGAMLARLAPQTEEEAKAIDEAGLNPGQILNCDELVLQDQIFFAATGITDGPLLKGVRYRKRIAETHSLVIRGETGTHRLITAETWLG